MSAWAGTVGGGDQFERGEDSLLLFANGAVAFFRHGEQVPEFQGRALEVIHRLATEVESLRLAAAGPTQEEK
jgi:hypothetical protein